MRFAYIACSSDNSSSDDSSQDESIQDNIRFNVSTADNSPVNRGPDNSSSDDSRQRYLRSFLGVFGSC